MIMIQGYQTKYILAMYFLQNCKKERQKGLKMSSKVFLQRQ